MTESQEKQKEYLKNIYRGKLPRENPFIIDLGNGKELFVISPGDNNFARELDIISRYRSLYDIVLDLKGKINFSLDNAIDRAYSDELIESFNVIGPASDDEWFAYYYIENALFRIETMWDILAQIYNIKYELGLDMKQVYHSRIFSSEERFVQKYWKNSVPKEIQSVSDYFNETDNTDISDGMWKGNYKYINDLRNNMTHKIAISQESFSSYSFSFKEPPLYILKRVTEGYAQLEDFIYIACKNIMAECLSECNEVE